MSDDPRTKCVTARIKFTGLMLMCINEKKQCEVGFVQCPGHDPKISVKISRPGVTDIEVITRITGDLYIAVLNPTSDKVTVNDKNDDWAFTKHHPDLERKPLHGDKVTVNTSVLSARVSVSAGDLFTHDVLGECDLVEWVDPEKPGTNPKCFGTLAKTTGLNITCKPDGEIAIFDRVAGVMSTLPVLPDTTYEIAIDSDCRPEAHASPEISDFRLYYKSKLIIGKDRKKFDFILKIPDDPDKRSPRICERAFLSKTFTLGLPPLSYEEMSELAKSENLEKIARKEPIR